MIRVNGRGFLMRALALLLVSGLWFQPAAEACGGSRAGLCTWTLTGSSTSGTSGTSGIHANHTHHTVQSGVRGSTYADVSVISPNRMRAHWVSGQLDGHIPGLGDIRLEFQDDRASTVIIDSEQKGGVPFFPAQATQELYYRLQVLDEAGGVARTLVNLEPMIMRAEIHSIPPYGSQFQVMNDVDFYDVSGPQPVSVVRLHVDSSGWLDNSGGINVRVTEQNIDYDTGTFAMVWEIEGSRTAGVDARWFATGIDGVEIESLVTEGDTFLAADAQTMAIRGTFDIENLDAAVAFHAYAKEGESFEGHSVFSFYEIARANR